MTVERTIEDRVIPDWRKPARLTLTWLRNHPDIVGTIEEVYAEGARGNSDAFREFAAVVWESINTEFGGAMEQWHVDSDDENWVSMLALIIGAWGRAELGRR